MSYYDELSRLYAQAAAQDAQGRKAGWLDDALGIAGGGVGFLLGGPAGAAAGYRIGKSVGDIGENAVNHTLTPGNVLGDLRKAWVSVSGLPAGAGEAAGAATPGAVSMLPRLKEAPMLFADGGPVPDPLGLPLWMNSEDRVPALMRPGEFVLTPEAMAQPGVPQMAEAANAAGRTFRPLSADPAMRAALGFEATVERGRHAEALDLLARALAGIDIPAPRNPHAPGYQRVLGSAVESAADTFNYAREKGAKRADEVQRRNDERAKMLNVAEINDALRRRREGERTDATAEKERAKREVWKVVPPAWAKAAGNPDLAWQRVDDGVYAGLLGAYNAWKDANRPRATSSALSPDQRFRLESNRRRFGARIEQVQRRMESLQKQADDPINEGDEALRAKISALADTLAQLQDQWDSADEKVYGGRASAAKPVAPAKPKDVFDTDVRITLPGGRAGTLKAGSKLPEGAKVIGG